jgi:hypothetical protein
MIKIIEYDNFEFEKVKDLKVYKTTVHCLTKDDNEYIYIFPINNFAIVVITNDISAVSGKLEKYIVIEIDNEKFLMTYIKEFDKYFIVENYKEFIEEKKKQGYKKL